MDFSSTQDVGRLGAVLAEIVLSAAGMGYLIIPLRTIDTFFPPGRGVHERSFFGGGDA